MTSGPLAAARTREILERHLPPPPARVVIVGRNGPARWLVEAGYDVVVVADVVVAGTAGPAEAPHGAGAPRSDGASLLGGLGALPVATGAADALVTVDGLSRLGTADQRRRALHEVVRATRPGGVVAVGARSRFAPVLEGLGRDVPPTPAEREAATRGLAGARGADGPGGLYLHHPMDLAVEVAGARVELIELVGVEGPGWLLDGLPERLADRAWREHLLWTARTLEREPTLVGISDHLLAVGRVPAGGAPGS